MDNIMYSGSVPVSIRYKVFDVRILWLIEPFIVYCEGSSLIFNTQVLYYCTISYWICFFRKYCLQFRDTPTYNKLTRSRVRRSSDLSENLSNIYLVLLVLCLSLLSMMTEAVSLLVHYHRDGAQAHWNNLEGGSGADNPVTDLRR